MPASLELYLGPFGGQRGPDFSRGRPPSPP